VIALAVMLPIGTPRNAIQTLDCCYGGVEVFRANMSSGIAASPYLTFFLRARESGALACRWLDQQTCPGWRARGSRCRSEHIRQSAIARLRKGLARWGGTQTGRPTGLSTVRFGVL
jgi:Sulphur oxidation protein SoxZ